MKMGCNSVKVLEDTSDGFPGVCQGLRRKPLSSNLSCEEDCKQNSSCPSWQIGTEGNCWQGVGKSCFVRPGFTPHGAQRLQHGEVRVLMELKGWQIVGLVKVFDNSQGYFTEEAKAITACKHACYSDIQCQFWQYAPSYGCYIETPELGTKVAYPLTLTSAYRSTPFAENCIAGEYVQHSCDRHHIEEPPLPPVPGVVKSGCAKVGYRWSPNAMSRTTEPTATACMQRCEKTPDCRFWSYWPDHGCHLQLKDAKLRLAEDWRVVSGTKWCEHTGARNDTGSPTTGWLTNDGKQALEAHAYLGSSQKRYSHQVLKKAIDGPEATPTPPPTPAPIVSSVNTNHKPTVALLQPTATVKRESALLGDQSSSGEGSLSSYWPILPVLLLLCCGGIAGGFFYSSLEQRKGSKKSSRNARNSKLSDEHMETDRSAHMMMAAAHTDSEGEYNSGSESSSYGGDDHVWQEEPQWPGPHQPSGYEQGAMYDGYGNYGGSAQAEPHFTDNPINRSTTRVCMSPEMEEFRQPLTGGRRADFTV
jgi:hypothetical protein